MIRRISLQNVFNVAWRLAILALPWQTRWFLDASLAGWPWEQGRLSMYVSWAFLVFAIVLGLIRFGRPRKIAPVVSVSVAIVSGVCAVAAFRFPDAASAIIQWWAEVGLLILFAMTLRRARVSFSSLAAWFVLSLLPHLALGFVQYAVQKVIGHPVLGMATQLPENPGVSVVEYADKRLLRAYGGFPHPNIFGGWLAMGILACLTLVASVSSKRDALLLSVASAAMSVALLITYSRSAWIAAAVGVAILCVHLFRQKKMTQFFVVAGVVSVLAVGIVGVSQRDAVLARTNPTTRLEVKSIDARTQGLRDGVELLKRYPLLGSGPNAELLVLANGISDRAPAPLEPPHNVFLLVLVDLGAIGFAALAVLAWTGMMRLRRSGRVMGSASLLAPLVVFACLDHYLWSAWAGLSLFAVALTLVALPTDD